MVTPHQTSLVFIAGFKTLKGLLLLLTGLGLLNLVHTEIATLFSHLIEALHVHADSRILHALVLKVDALQPHTVLVMGVISLGYGGLLLIEGVGLWFEASWAAYLTVISTSLLLPFELSSTTGVSISDRRASSESRDRGLPCLPIEAVHVTFGLHGACE